MEKGAERYQVEWILFMESEERGKLVVVCKHALYIPNVRIVL